MNESSAWSWALSYRVDLHVGHCIFGLLLSSPLHVILIPSPIWPTHPPAVLVQRTQPDGLPVAPGAL